MRFGRIVWISVAMTAVLCLASLPAAAAEGSFQRTLPVNGPVNLDISTGSGSIEVRVGSGSQVEVTGHIKAGEWFDSNAEEKVKKLEQNPPIQQSGNDIRIGHIEDPELRHDVSISYEVTVPAPTELHTHSGSGNQTVEGIRGPANVESGSGGVKISAIGDNVHAEAGSGNIELRGVRGSAHARTGSGSIRAMDIAGGFEGETGSGKILLEQSAPGSVRAETGSGGLELRGLNGSLEAKAGSGDIRAEGHPTGAWSVRTGSGSVELKLPSDAAFDLNAHTSSGSISVDHPVTVQGSIERKEVRGKVRGGGVPVEVATGSGNIQIQ
ncbi:MAG TPA: DUF4097 family beta strand repeat-containing protein [Terriglobales bacterium]|nr:DUF4097 family beta strand repeat-containing protein [Terriglobales bacterium]